MAYRGLYKPENEEFYKLSRSKVESHIKCPRCFYLDRRLGVSQPPGFPFNLNSAVDHLLKTEFDIYREESKPHPYIKKLGLNAVPYRHRELDNWRNNFRGVVYEHPKLKFHLFGAVDDIWMNLDTEELIVVDYKATSKNSEINLDAEWQNSYKRQMEFYQYLLKNNGFKVSKTGYFVYCNGIKQRERFDENLEFEVHLLPYKGNTSWIEPQLIDLKKCLNQEHIPEFSDDCEYCKYQIQTSKLKLI